MDSLYTVAHTPLASKSDLSDFAGPETRDDIVLNDTIRAGYDTVVPDMSSICERLFPLTSTPLPLGPGNMDPHQLCILDSIVTGKQIGRAHV